MAAGLPSWSPGSWAAARSPCTPPKRLGVAQSQAMTPAPSSPQMVSHRRGSQRALTPSDRRSYGLARKSPDPATPGMPPERLALEMRSTPPTKTTKDGKMPRPRARAASETGPCESKESRPRGAHKSPGDQDSQDSQALKELKAENRTLRALADRLQLQLAAVEESGRRYQNAAEELLIGAWEDQMDRPGLGREDEEELLAALVHRQGDLL
ncbi:unnamed protein product [Cladocopium goreaui]|uniref:Uncharacterized protein n=1 Tax=Cladocopium goreaui TaxID=2562237 RepID=A0A9P1CN01_9DINO|nr:unnamed protein product [Cladocopium goreaui]